jgi:tetratricopeptide (TPR) repeat protein
MIFPPGIIRAAACLSLFFMTTAFQPARGQQSLDSADAHFKAGRFAEAEEAYLKVPQGDPAHFRAVLRSGYIALLSNRLEEARLRLTGALEMKPDDRAALSLLAEAWYRTGDFEKAAPLLKAMGREAKAAQMESFKGLSPFRIEGQSAMSVLKFVVTDPLPVVEVRVNGGRKANFFIDTGGAEVIVDPQLAKEAQVPVFGSETGTFAGGKQAGLEFGRAEALALGDFTVRDLPVQVLPVRQFSGPVFGGLQVDGIIGTVLLYHFLATLDYPEGRLVLRRRTPESEAAFEKEIQGEKCVSVPFWMAGDHYMVAWGTVNKSRPLLFFVDTGLAGGGFTCPESTIREAGIKLPKSPAGEGMGGGGKVAVFPFVVDELSLGEARVKNVRGLFSGPFTLEEVFGFHIGGLISHGFFRPYAVTFDFNKMRIIMARKAVSPAPGIRRPGPNLQSRPGQD